MSYPKPNFSLLSLFTAGLPLLVACGVLPTDLKDILPDDRAISLRVPGAQVPSSPANLGVLRPLLGAASEYQGNAAAIATVVNGHVVDLVGRIRSIASYPPNSMQGNTYIWGPYSPGGLDPLNYRFTAVKTAEARYTIRLDARPASDSTAKFQTLLDGVVERVLGSETNQGKGNFTVDFDNRRILDPNWMTRGKLSIVYDASTEPRAIEVTLQGFDPSSALASNGGSGGLGQSGLHTEPNAEPAADSVLSTYRYTEAEDSSGTFHFSLRLNVQDASLPAAETVTLNARWDAAGRGRADSTMSGEDVPVQLQAAGIDGDVIHATECWDEQFQVVFQDSNPVELRSTLRDLQGDAATCAFAEADYPPEP